MFLADIFVSSEFSVSQKGGRTMDIVTNTFCAVRRLMDQRVGGSSS